MQLWAQDLPSEPPLSSVDMMGEREDELKIFLGSLSPDINKPQLQALFSNIDMQPVEIFVPQPNQNKLAVAFVTWKTNEECWVAIQAVRGLADSRYTPSAIQAHRGDPSGESLSAVVFRIFSNFKMLKL